MACVVVFVGLVFFLFPVWSCPPFRVQLGSTIYKKYKVTTIHQEKTKQGVPINLTTTVQHPIAKTREKGETSYPAKISRSSYGIMMLALVCVASLWLNRRVFSCCSGWHLPPDRSARHLVAARRWFERPLPPGHSGRRRCCSGWLRLGRFGQHHHCRCCCCSGPLPLPGQSGRHPLPGRSEQLRHCSGRRLRCSGYRHCRCSGLPLCGLMHR